MRRERKNIEKIRKRNIALMGLFIITIMVFSTFAIFSGGAESFAYNGFKFTYDEDSHAFFTKIGKEKMYFAYKPSSVENIPVSADIVSLYINAPGFYMTFDPDVDDLHKMLFDQLRLDFVAYTGKNILGATTKKSEIYTDIYNFPVKTCSDATPSSPVIHLRVSNQTSIYSEDSCIVFESREEGFVMLRDRFYYALFGVIDNVQKS